MNLERFNNENERRIRAATAAWAAEFARLGESIDAAARVLARFGAAYEAARKNSPETPPRRSGDPPGDE